MKQYSIADYGAKEGSLSTRAIQAAIDAAFRDGGGEVIIPRGIFLTGSVRLRSHIVLHMLPGAVLKGSSELSDYEMDYSDTVEPIRYEDGEDDDCLRGNFLHPWFNGILRAFHAEDIRIIGKEGSVIDGGNLFNPNGEEGYRGPQAICMTYCKNLEFSGYTVKDSGNWAHTIHKCSNIFAHNLTVLGGHDGFHVRLCQNILIEDCEFYTGDDCIAGYINENMVIRNCVLDCACSAMRLGGTDILVDHCRTHAPSRYGFRQILFDSVTVTGYRNPVIYTRTDGEILFKNCPPIPIQKTDRLIDRYV